METIKRKMWKSQKTKFVYGKQCANIVRVMSCLWCASDAVYVVC